MTFAVSLPVTVIDQGRSSCVLTAVTSVNHDVGLYATGEAYRREEPEALVIRSCYLLNFLYCRTAMSDRRHYTWHMLMMRGSMNILGLTSHVSDSDSANFAENASTEIICFA